MSVCILWLFYLQMIQIYSKKEKNIEIMQREVNDELQNIAVWLQVNKLSLNIKKTHFMLFL